MLGFLAMTIGYNTVGSVSLTRLNDRAAVSDGTDPPHAVDTDGNKLPDSSATQPCKPIILSKDSKDASYLELKPEAAFDHTKHNTDLKHSLDGKTLNSCVYCHHTEQPMPVAGLAYLVKSERTQILTEEQLKTSNQAVNSCRHCHFQTDEGSPKKVKYPKGSEPIDAKGEAFLTNRVAYHIRCISCHEAAKKRDPQLKPLKDCAECHVKKT